MPSSLNIQSVFGNALDIADARERQDYLDRMCAGDTALRAELEDLLKAEIDAAGSGFMADPAAGSGVVSGLARDLERDLKDGRAPLSEASNFTEAPPLTASSPLHRIAAENRNAGIMTTVVIGVVLVAVAASAWMSLRFNDEGNKALSTVNERKAATAEADRRERSEAALKLSQPYGRQFERAFATELELRAGLRAFSALSTRDRVGGFEKAIPILEHAAGELREKVGDDVPEALLINCTLAALSFNAGHAERALPLIERTLEKQKAILGHTHEDTLFCMSELAFMYMETGQPANAIPLDEFVVQKTTAAELRIRALSDLANAWLISGLPEKAISPGEQAIENCQAVFGPDDPRTAREIAALARACLRTGQTERAIAMCADAVENYARKFGADNSATLTVMDQLGTAYAYSHQLDKAIPLLEQTLMHRKRVVGAEHPDTVLSMSHLAFSYAKAKRYQEAERLLQKALELQKAKFGGRHYNTLGMLDALIANYIDMGLFEPAIALAESTVAAKKITFGEFHKETLKSRHTFAHATARFGQVAGAVTLFEVLVQDCKAHLAFGAPETLSAMYNLNQTLTEAGDHVRAEKGSRELLALQIKTFGDYPEVAAPTLDQLSTALLAQKEIADAEPFLRQSLAIRQKYGPDECQTYLTRCMLGSCLFRLQKYAEGEPVLLAGYEGLKLRHNPTSAYETGVLAETEKELVTYYISIGQLAKAKALKQEN